MCVSRGGVPCEHHQCRARPTSLGGGRARLSAAAGDPRGGRESSQFALGQIGVRRGPISPACMRGFCGEAAAVLVPLAVASGSDRLAWRATEWGRLPGGRGRGQRQPLGVVLVGAPRSEGGGTCSRPLVAHPPALNRSGCCDDCPELWMTRTGLPACAWEPCRVGTPWVACGGPTRASPSCPLVAPRGRREDANPSGEKSA